MDGQRFKLTGGPFRQVGQQREGEEVTIPLAEAHLDFSVKDSVEDFRLPINHRPVENLIIDDLEQASLDTQLTSSNIGYRLLQKMGWKGKGLGKDEQGIVEPIKAGIRDPKLGVGKQEQDDFFTAEENVQRRRLEVELEETEELAKKREVLSFSCNFYYLVASTACFVQMMTIQVIAEREQKIQTEVKEIKKVFFCNLCNKQYKLAVEFEAHLSSYDHNHRKRFKEMRDMRASSSRDDRQKKEQLRQEKEVAKFAAQMADARRRQHEQLQEQSEVPTDSSKGGNATPVNDQRQTLKFGFTSKLGSTKNPAATAAKKAKIAVKVTSVFGNDSDEES
ncbi:G patch domain-containing protein 8 isoform X2 [Dendrobium catenatum]|uniref:G patch domain-containing protein 8 isoform X2 n=1 Tax=Dendrobium catenatum TaxID=906689 RepID=UPI0010A07C0D|nr:G patch domain-containing protein 8 isoform X2 [Dendrobium catenatum]